MTLPNKKKDRKLRTAKPKSNIVENIPRENVRENIPRENNPCI